MNLVSLSPDDNPYAENAAGFDSGNVMGPPAPTPNSQDTSLNLVSLDPNLNPYAGNAMGLPSDPVPSSAPPGLPQSIGDEIASGFNTGIGAVENVFTDIYAGGKKVVGTVYSDVKGGVSTVVGDVASPVSSTLKTTYWYLILGVVVIAGGLYFIGKTGAVKVSV